MTETNVEDTRPETSIPGHAPECFFCLDKSTSFVHENFAWDKGFIDAQVPRNTDYVAAEVQQMLDQLEGMMANKAWDASWPVVLLLATNK